jgi:hypothetical protein
MSPDNLTWLFGNVSYEEIYSGGHHSAESYPTPAEMFGTLAKALFAVVYMVTVFLLLTTVLVR